MMEDEGQNRLLDVLKFYSRETSGWVELYEDEGEKLLSWAETYADFAQFEVVYSSYYNSTPLHHAIRRNNITILKKILLKGADIHRPDIFLITPLYFAILMDRDEIIKTFLDHGVKATDTFAINECEFSYFQKVIQYSSKTIIKLFIKNGCDVNQIFTTDHWESPKFSRPIHIAAMNKRLEIIELLLNYKANVNDVTDQGDTALHIACEVNFLEAVDLLLRNNALVNIFSKNNLTPLCQAIKKNNSRMVELLLSYGAFIDYDIPAVDYKTYTAIHSVIAGGLIKMLSDLLSHGLDANGSSKFNKISFLHTAVEKNQIEMVHLLLKYNAEIKVQDSLGRTPLHIAAANSNKEIIQLLLQSDINLQVSPENSTLNCMEGSGYTPLHSACTKTDIDCVQYLLECGADVNAESHKGVRPLHLTCEIGNLNMYEVLTDDKLTPLHIAVKNCHEKIVELLLMNGADTMAMSENSVIPLEIAVQLSHLRIVELLLQYNSDVNNHLYRKVFFNCLCEQIIDGYQIIDNFFKYGFLLNSEEYRSQEILLNAAKNGYSNVVQCFLSEGVNAGTIINGESLLHCAAKKKHVEIVHLLLMNGADIYVKDSKEQMPIYYSIVNKDERSVELFLHSGFDIRTYPNLLHCAVQECNKRCRKIVELLVKYGADINYFDDQGNALHVLIKYVGCLLEHNADDYIEAFTVLLEKGVNVNARRLDGRTPLQMAIYANLEKILIELLLQYGADPNLKSSGIEAPLHIALRRKSCYVKMLLNYGADINEVNAEGNTPTDVIYHNVKKVIDYRQKLSQSGSYSVVLIFEISQIMNDFCLDSFETLRKHILKLKSANLYLNKNNMKYLERKSSDNPEEVEYEREIAELQSFTINDISAFDLLRKQINVIARYVKHGNMQKLRELLKANAYPHYGNMILARLEAAYTRQSFVNTTQQFLYSVISKCGLPDPCIEHIIDYLSNDDLRYLSNFFVSSEVI